MGLKLLLLLWIALIEAVDIKKCCNDLQVFDQASETCKSLDPEEEETLEANVPIYANAWQEQPPYQLQGVKTTVTNHGMTSCDDNSSLAFIPLINEELGLESGFGIIENMLLDFSFPDSDAKYLDFCLERLYNLPIGPFASGVIFRH